MQASVILLIVILLSNALTAWRTMRMPAFPGRTEYFLMTMSGSWWAVTAAFDANSDIPEVKLFFSEVAWYGIITTPMFWMLFVRSYIKGSDSPDTSIGIVLSMALGLATLMIALTNQFHHLIYTSVVPDPTPAHPEQLVYHHGIGYFFAAALIYVLMLMTVVRTMWVTLLAPPLLRMQYMALLVSALVPWAANAAYNFGGLRVLGYDPTPLAFWILPIAYNFMISRRNLFTVAPIALSAVFKAHPDAIIVAGPDGFVLMANPTADRLFPGETSLVGLPLDRLTDYFSRDDTTAMLSDRDVWCLGERWYEHRRVPVMDGTVERAHALVLRDVTAFMDTQRDLRVAAKLMEERLEANLRLHEQLREMALRDSLTGLYNRRIIEDIGDRLIANADATSKPLSAVSLDLDHFKQLNDSYGHKAGDDALVMVSGILSRSLRPNEVAIRMGGEEFLVLMPDVDVATAAARVEAWRTLLKIMPITTSRGEAFVEFSAGVGAYPDNASDFSSLMQKVDKAVYAAKNSGRDRVVICKTSPARAA